jgi:hypothetical protein
MSTVFASAADARYGYHLVNLLASVHANSPDVFDRVVVHDLGLTEHQRSLVDRLPGVEVRGVPPFSPHWAEGFTWKPWIWTHLDDASRVFYLDAGATVLRSLAPALAQAGERGYFLVSQRDPLVDIVPSDYWTLYGVDPGRGGRPYAAAGILAFRTSGEFWDGVIVPTYEHCLAGRSLGFSAGDLYRNRGLAHEEAPPIRDCKHFRWDQTVLNLHIARELPDAVLADYDEYAGVLTPRDHPRQVIWAHRIRGDLRYLKRAPYAGPGAWRSRAFGLRYQLRWWRKLNEKWFQRSTYVWKVRKLAGR